MAEPTMQVKIQAPFKIYYDGLATSFSGVNDTGPFDVLPKHKNFISLLKPGTITVRKEGSPNFNLAIQKGVVHVKANKVVVFLDI